jgi:predicted dithiol-disulfide oxidoreductase (DUF899 family)
VIHRNAPEEIAAMAAPRIISREQWLEARRALLVKEKAFTAARDALSEERRKLPWVAVAKEYTFASPSGKRSLADLFGERSQLVVYHFMFGPDWGEGCKSCSFWADNFDRIVPHLAARDVALVAVSRAPLTKLDAFKARMGWTFPWVSSDGSTFNYDFAVSFRPEQVEAEAPAYNFGTLPPYGEEAPGISVFAKGAAGKVFHTYSTYARGLDMLNAAYHYLDLVPKGRDEAALDWPMQWVRLRDEYGA